MNPTQVIARLQEIRRFGFDNPGRAYSTAKMVEALINDVSREREARRCPECGTLLRSVAAHNLRSGAYEVALECPVCLIRGPFCATAQEAFNAYEPN